MIEHHVMANPRNAKRVIISLTREQAKEHNLAGNCISGWTGNPIIDTLIQTSRPERVHYE